MSVTNISLKDFRHVNKQLIMAVVEIEKLKEENEKLKKELNREREAVDFYAHDGNWTAPFNYDNKYHPCIVLSDVDQCTVTESFGGKKARETKSKREIEL